MTLYTEDYYRATNSQKDAATALVASFRWVEGFAVTDCRLDLGELLVSVTHGDGFRAVLAIGKRGKVIDCGVEDLKISAAASILNHPERVG